MHQKIQKWGNSLALRIPNHMAKSVKISQGSVVNISTRDDSIIIKPITPKEYRLDQLLQQITRDNLHNETDTGFALGKEKW